MDHRTAKESTPDETSRPAVGGAHVVLAMDCMAPSCQFMRTMGMRAIFDGPSTSVYEMRGGTHLILVVAGKAPFDLMVDDLHATRRRFISSGLDPSPIEAHPAIGHEVFTVRAPSGHVFTFFSSHASGKPV